MNNINGTQISGFSALLYVNFIIKKKYRVDFVAKEMRIATDTLYRYIRGENIIPPDRIIDLIQATKDIEYLDFFCEPIGYLAVPAPKGELSPSERKQNEIDLSILNGKTLEAIEQAYDDGQITKNECRQIHRLLTRLQEKAGELKEKIRKEAL
jgi:hypothetical protein